MFLSLLLVVALAVLAVGVSKAAGARPLGWALIGLMSLVLGAHVAVLFTNSSLVPLMGGAVLAQEPADADDADDADDASATASDAAADEPAADEQPADEQPADEQPADEPPAAEDPAAADAAEAADDVPAPQADAEADAAEGSSDAADDPAAVQPVTRVHYPDRVDGAPQWLEKDRPWNEGSVRFVPVLSGVQFTLPECDAPLKQRIQAATGDYINQFLESKHAARLIGYSEDELTRRRSQGGLVEDTFEERVIVSTGPVYQTHALLAFDDEFRSDLLSRWERVRVGSRLLQTALAAGTVLLLLTTVFGYFKLDTATRGYYTGRLQFAAAAAILAVIAATVLFAKLIPWM